MQNIKNHDDNKVVVDELLSKDHIKFKNVQPIINAKGKSNALREDIAYQVKVFYVTKSIFFYRYVRFRI
jgi:phosphatidylglycerophosphatase A